MPTFEALGIEGLAEGAIQASTTGRTVTSDGRLFVPVVAGTEEFGFLGFDQQADLDDAGRRILERGALVTALLLLFRRTVAEAESRGHRELLDDLLTAGDQDRDHLPERARLLGADLRHDQTVVVVEISGRRPSTSEAPTFLAGRLGGLVSRVEGRLVFLVPSDDPGTAARAVRDDLARTLGSTVTGAAAAAGADLARIPQAYAEAGRTLDALLALGREGQASGVDELGCFGLLLGSERDVPAFVRATLGPVLEYDERRGTDLVATLDAYFTHGGNLARTGKALTVHTNTVAQRLGRNSQLLGEGWQEPERALEVHLALRLHRLGSNA